MGNRDREGISQHSPLILLKNKKIFSHFGGMSRRRGRRGSGGGGRGGGGCSSLFNNGEGFEEEGVGVGGGWERLLSFDLVTELLIQFVDLLCFFSSSCSSSQGLLGAFLLFIFLFIGGRGRGEVGRILKDNCDPHCEGVRWFWLEFFFFFFFFFSFFSKPNKNRFISRRGRNETISAIENLV